MTVNRPLGGSFTLDYQAKGNTYKLPQLKWVLSSIEVNDGYQGDGIDRLLKKIEYEDGKYDRFEREFNGFSCVTIKDIDPDLDNIQYTANDYYRKVVREYGIDSYYARGLLLTEIVYDSNNNPYIKTKNYYKLIDINTEQELINSYPYNMEATVFPQLRNIDKYYYEGQVAAGASTSIQYAYDSNGNITMYLDAGGPGEDDDVEVVIDYYNDLQNYIVLPEIVSIYDSDDNLLRYREGEYSRGSGDLIRLSQNIDSDRMSITDMEYYPDGNLKQLTGPENSSGDKYSREFSYDLETRTYPVKVEDSFGYLSTAEYDYSFGQPLSSTDMNGNQINRI